MVHQEMRRQGLTYQVRRTPSGKVRARGWTKKDVDYLKSRYRRLSVSQIAKDLGRTVYSVDSKVRSLGLNRYKPMNVRKLADLIGVSQETIRARRDKLGLEFCRVVDGPAKIRGIQPHEIHAICTDILENPGKLWVSAKKMRGLVKEQEILMGWHDCDQAA